MKTVFILFLLVWLIPCWFFFIVHYYNWHKSWAKIKWWTVIWPLGVFGLTEFVMFFPAWYTRNIPILKWFFWIWLDDSRFLKKDSPNILYRYAPDYYQFLNGYNETMWKAYKWHIRNRIWNLDSLFRPKRGKRKIIEFVYDRLFMGGKRVNQDVYWTPMARLKYWKDGKESDQNNNGKVISKMYSIFGKGYVWEKVGKRLTFRYSFCISFLWLYWNFIAGENDQRFVFSFKIKRKRPIK